MFNTAMVRTHPLPVKLAARDIHVHVWEPARAPRSPPQASIRPRGPPKQLILLKIVGNFADHAALTRQTVPRPITTFL